MSSKRPLHQCRELFPRQLHGSDLAKFILPSIVYCWHWLVRINCRWRMLVTTQTNMHQHLFLHLRLEKLTSSSFLIFTVNQIINYAQYDIQVTPCVDGTYCCGQANDSCCNQGQGVKIPLASVFSSSAPGTTSATLQTISVATSPPLTTISSITSTTSSPITSTITLGTTIVLTGTSTSTISASTNSSTARGGSSSNSDGSGISEEARIGIGIGCGVFVIIGIGAATWIVYKWRSRRSGSRLHASGKDVVEVRPKAF